MGSYLDDPSQHDIPRGLIALNAHEHRQLADPASRTHLIAGLWDDFYYETVTGPDAIGCSDCYHPIDNHDRRGEDGECFDCSPGDACHYLIRTNREGDPAFNGAFG